MSLEISQDRAEDLLEMCIEKWITIRGFSFADSIQELFKQKDKKGTEKAKALRKTLKYYLNINTAVDFAK